MIISQLYFTVSSSEQWSFTKITIHEIKIDNVNDINTSKQLDLFKI